MLDDDELITRSDHKNAREELFSDFHGGNPEKVEVSIPADLHERLQDWLPYSSMWVKEIDGEAVLFIQEVD